MCNLSNLIIIQLFMVFNKINLGYAYQYMGCFRDQLVRDLPKFAVNQGRVSVEICGALCATSHYIYAGLQDGY